MKPYRTQVRFTDRALAEKVKRLACVQGRSMNAQIIHLIRQGVEHERHIPAQK